jgi:hypothetical protein
MLQRIYIGIDFLTRPVYKLVTIAHVRSQAERERYESEIQYHVT